VKALSWCARSGSRADSICACARCVLGAGVSGLVPYDAVIICSCHYSFGFHWHFTLVSASCYISPAIAHSCSAERGSAPPKEAGRLRRGGGVGDGRRHDGGGGETFAACAAAACRSSGPRPVASILCERMRSGRSCQHVCMRCGPPSSSRRAHLEGGQQHCPPAAEHCYAAQLGAVRAQLRSSATPRAEQCSSQPEQCWPADQHLDQHCSGAVLGSDQHCSAPDPSTARLWSRTAPPGPPALRLGPGAVLGRRRSTARLPSGAVLRTRGSSAGQPSAVLPEQCGRPGSTAGTGTWWSTGT
jgi:hypothetical protein